MEIKLSQRINHKTFGKGTVMGLFGNEAYVAFDNPEVKTLPSEYLLYGSIIIVPIEEVEVIKE